MWVFSQYGFLSAVVFKADPRQIVIRSRNRRHLENLIKRFDLKAHVVEFAGTDYQYRILVSKQTWVEVAAGLANEIDYTNFKDRAAMKVKWVGQLYLSSLHEIWQLLWDAAQPKKLHFGGHKGRRHV